MIEKLAVAAILKYEKKILILKRGKEAECHRGKWSSIAGKIKKSETPLEAVLREIEEEVGMRKDEVELVWYGNPLRVEDKEVGVIWKLYPFLFEAKTDRVMLERENVEYRWIRPAEIYRHETVPEFKKALKRLNL